jgi:hypothetical protein
MTIPDTSMIAYTLLDDGDPGHIVDWWFAATLVALAMNLLLWWRVWRSR